MPCCCLEQHASPDSTALAAALKGCHTQCSTSASNPLRLHTIVCNNASLQALRVLDLSKQARLGDGLVQQQASWALQELDISLTVRLKCQQLSGLIMPHPGPSCVRRAELCCTSWSCCDIAKPSDCCAPGHACVCDMQRMCTAARVCLTCTDHHSTANTVTCNDELSVVICCTTAGRHSYRPPHAHTALPAAACAVLRLQGGRTQPAAAAPAGTGSIMPIVEPA